MSLRPLAYVTTLMLMIANHASAAPEVVVYGASWCGPCQMVKSFLDLNKVSYTFLDIDQPANRESMRRAAPQARGIPVIKINDDTILGADFEAMAQSLSKAGTRAEVPKRGGKEGVDLFGGQPPAWWQSQFRRIAAMKAAVEEEIKKLKSSETVADNVELAKIDAKNAQVELLDGTFQMLDDDASRFGLPRQYRE